MVNKEVFNELTIDDLQEQHKMLAEILGMDALLRLSECCGGTQVYIPMPFELMKDAIYKRINEEFNGGNIQALAIKYKVSESTVYRVARDKITEKRLAPFDGQISLV